MRNLLLPLAGFLLGTALIVPLLFLSRPTSATVKPSASQPVAMSLAGMSSNSQMMASASLPTRKLTIRHVMRGCHVWSNGTTTGAMMRLHLEVGQKLSITDMDVDAHRMLQFAGPMQLRMGDAPMMTTQGITLMFPKKGVYRLGTKTVEMKGMNMAVKTIGPDNKLRLVVTVA